VGRAEVPRSVQTQKCPTSFNSYYGAAKPNQFIVKQCPDDLLYIKRTGNDDPRAVRFNVWGLVETQLSC